MPLDGRLGRSVLIDRAEDLVSARDQAAPGPVVRSPTSSSWLNMVEILLGRLTDKAIRRGIFHTVPDLIQSIETYLAQHNNNPQPFRWTATTEPTLEKVRRGRVTLDAIAS